MGAFEGFPSEEVEEVEEADKEDEVSSSIEEMMRTLFALVTGNSFVPALLAEVFLPLLLLPLFEPRAEELELTGELSGVISLASLLL